MAGSGLFYQGDETDTEEGAPPIDPLERLKISPERKRIWDAISMSVSFGGKRRDFKEALFRLLLSDSSLISVFESLAGFRGIQDTGMRERLGLRLFENKTSSSEKVPRSTRQACLGSLLHYARGWNRLEFPPGTLFEQREVNKGVAGDAPTLFRTTDASQRLLYPLDRLMEGGGINSMFHVTSFHRRALLPPGQVNFLQSTASDKLSLNWVKDLAEDSKFSVSTDVVMMTLRDLFGSSKMLETYWDNHIKVHPQADYIQKEYAFAHVATFQQYCRSLHSIGEGIWAIQNKIWDPLKGRFALERVLKEIYAKTPMNHALIESEIYAAMMDAATYVKSAGILADAQYHAGKAITPATPAIESTGQHNLLGIVHYWVSHATDASNPGKENTDMCRYLEVVYDFLYWAGSVGLFAFFLPGTNTPAESLDDLSDIADAEGIYENLEKSSNVYTKNPRMYGAWPFPIAAPKRYVRTADWMQNAMKVILFRRMQRVFDLLKRDSFVIVGKRGLNALVREVLMAAFSGDPSPTGFEWVRLHLPKDYTSYLDSFMRFSYRYIVNYIGGMLVFFPQYLDSDLGGRSDDWVARSPSMLKHPLDRWRYYLEIAYMITLNTFQPATEANKRMASIIKDILPVLTGRDVGGEIESAVGKVRRPKKVKEIRSIAQKDWDTLIDDVFEKLVTDTERGKFEEYGEGITSLAPIEEESSKAEYYKQLRFALRPFIVKHIARIRALRHFYRTHYFYIDPELVDVLHPDFLKGQISDTDFNQLLMQEVNARRIAGRGITGSWRRVRVMPPLEIADLLSRVVLDKDGNPHLLNNSLKIEGNDEKFRMQSEQQLDESMKNLVKEDKEGRLLLRFYKEDGSEVRYAINEHAWHAIQHEDNQRLGWHVWNWEEFAACISQRGGVVEEEPLTGKRMVVEDVTAAAITQLKRIKQSTDLMAKTARALLEELPKSFPVLAAFAFTNRLPKECLKSLRDQDTLAEVSNFVLNSLARMMRNLFDQSTGGKERDSFAKTFPHVLGKFLNRIHLGDRLDALHKTMMKKITDRDEKKVAILSWGKAKRFLLYLCDARFIFDGGGSLKVDITRPLIRHFSDTWGVKNILAAIDVMGNMTEVIEKFRKAYPWFNPNEYPASGRAFEATKEMSDSIVKGSEEEGGESLLEKATDALEDIVSGEETTGEEGTEQSKALSRDELLLSVMRALVLDLEEKENAAKEKSASASRIINLKIKLLKMIYAYEALLCPRTAKKEELDAYYKEMSDNGLPVYGLRFLIDVPVILPSMAFSRALGMVVSEVVRNAYVLEKSLISVKISDKVPETAVAESKKKKASEEGKEESQEGEGLIEEEISEIVEKVSGDDEGSATTTVKGPWTLRKAETFRTAGFNAARTNYMDAVQEVLSILATANAFGVKPDSWKDFVTGVTDAWKKRFTLVKKADKGVINISKLFDPLLAPTREGFNDFAKVLQEKIALMEDGKIRSLYQDPEEDPKLKPLPLWLSDEQPTLGLILPFTQIKQYLDAGAVIPLREMMHGVSKKGKDYKNWEWKVKVGGEDQTLTSVFPPGTIPFCIDCPPITEDDANDPDVKKFFGEKHENPVRQEVNILPKQVKETDNKTGSEDWEGRYRSSLNTVEEKIEDLLKRMHTLRQFELDIKRRLVRRWAVIGTLIKLGKDANDINSFFKQMTPKESAFNELKPEESDAIDQFCRGWKAGTSEPNKVVTWVNTSEAIDQDKPTELAVRIDAFFTRERCKKLADLLGLDVEQIRTWDNKVSPSPPTPTSLAGEPSGSLPELLPPALQELLTEVGDEEEPFDKNTANNIARRAIQLQALIGFHLDRLGYNLRGLRSRREFFKQSIERILIEKKEKKEQGEKLAGRDSHDIIKKILDFLHNGCPESSLFNAYTHGDILPCYIKLGKGTPVPQKSKDGTNGGKGHLLYDCKGRLMRRFKAGATIGAVQIQAPKYPSMAVGANVLIRAKPVPPTYAAAWDNEYGSKLDKDLFLCLDINRLDCPRTITPDAVRNRKGKPETPIDEEEDIANWSLPLEHWAMLADLCSFPLVKQTTSGSTQDKVTPRAHAYTGRTKRGTRAETKPVNTAETFREKVFSAVFEKDGHRWYRMEPTPAKPYDVLDRNNTIEINFLDEVGALMKYWGHKHAHLERKMAPIIRKMTQVWDKDREHWIRLRTELYYLNRRGETLRDAILQYLFRVVRYCQVRLGAKYIAHERLGLSPVGEGGLGRIVSSMLKDFSPVQNYFIQQNKLLGLSGTQVPKPEPVGAQYTSRTCNWCARHGVKGRLDDRGSSEWAICDICERIYDRHRNGATNTGDRAVGKVYGKKKDKTKTDEEEES